MRYIPLSSHTENHPALNAPLCNFICSCMGGFQLDWFLLLESNWKQFCIRVPWLVTWRRAESCNFPLKTSCSKWGWCFLPLDWVLFIAFFPGKSTSMGRSHGKLLFKVCGHSSPALEQKEHLRALTKGRPGQACQVSGEGRGGKGEEEEKPMRINAGEDKIPKLAWRGLAVNNHRGASPLTLRMGPKDLSKGQTLGWGRRAWVTGWIKGRDPGLMDQDFLERKKSLQKSCPDLSPQSCACPELPGLFPTPERIYLGTQDWIMLVIVWAFWT